MSQERGPRINQKSSEGKLKAGKSPDSKQIMEATLRKLCFSQLVLSGHPVSLEILNSCLLLTTPSHPPSFQ